MPIICEKPLILTLHSEEQHERLDFSYYLPEFIYAEKSIENCEVPLTTLGEIMEDDASYGVLPPSSSYLEEGGIFLLRSSNVSNSGVDYENAVKVPAEWINTERARINENDILISIKGARAFFDMCVVSDAPPKAIVNGSLFRFHCKAGYDPRFVVLWLLSKPIQTLVFRERTNLGISYISLGILRNIPVPMLSTSEQTKILDGFEKTIQIKNEMITSLYEISIAKEKASKKINKIYREKLEIAKPSMSMMKVRIVQSSRLQDRLDWKTYDPNLINDTKKLSKDFTAITLMKDVANIKNGYKSAMAYDLEEVKLIRVKLYGKGAELREVKSASDISGPVVRAEKGEVVVAKIDCTQGAVAIIPDDLDGGMVSKEFFILNVDERKYRAQLLLEILLHRRYVQYLLSFRTGATNRLRLDKEVLQNLPLPDISLSQQDIILDELRLAEAHLSNIESIEKNANKMAEGLIEEVLENLLALCDKEHALKIYQSAELLKMKILKLIEEELK